MKSRLHHSPKPDSMKCVRMTYAPCAIKRISSEEAIRLVNGGMAVYVSKIEWRAQERREQEKKAA